MSKKRLLWQLYPSYFLITLFALLALSWFLSYSFRNFFLDQRSADLESRVRFVESELSATSSLQDTEKLSQLCKDLRKKTGTRITVIDLAGKVLVDTDEDPARMDNHADRPEVKEALQHKPGSAIRYSNTLKENMMYRSIPVEESGKVIAVVRVGLPITAIDTALSSIQGQLIFGAILIAVAAGAMSWWVSRRISQPLEEMRQGAERFAQGDFQVMLPVSELSEFGVLAETLNQMAAQLDERIRTVIGQRKEQEAVLSSMVEGVLAVDSDERLISLNRAAAQLFRVPISDFQGKSLQETVRNTDLHRFVAKILSSQTPVEGEIVLMEEEERFLQVHGTVLRDANNERIGALIVLNDVTRLRKLESVRKDFVANVSHELKTPITSIKGFVETLLDGAMNQPEDAKRFLEIIAGQADRLNAIIEDLLSLSRIEQDAEKGEIELQNYRFRELLRSAIQNCEPKANARNVRIKADTDPDLQRKINPQLLEQAVINLIDNAIKYSEAGSEILVSAHQKNGEIILSVKDQGCGIEKHHLARIFERFYRVDKSRSRKQGGTGLGLAIVKHIAQAHHGSVDVESSPGKGSTFRIHLPILN